MGLLRGQQQVDEPFIDRETEEKTMTTGRPFEDWYDEYFDKVNRYLRYRVSNVWDADDLTTTVFLKAFEKMEQVERVRSFGAWIFRIAHNTYVDYLRKKKDIPLGEGQEFRLPETSVSFQPEEQALSRERIQHLHRLLHRLPPDQRDVLTLRYFGDLKLIEVAEVLGRSESSVKMLSYRGIRQLRALWREGEPR